MSAATRAKTAKARATIAIRLLKTAKPYPCGYGLGRNFDDCFEMGDGDEVYRVVITRALTDTDLVSAMQRHGCNSWLEDLKKKQEAINKTPELQGLLFV